MENLEPIKRSVVSITAKFFDPLGIVSLFFEMFTQKLCEAGVKWDKAPTNDLLVQRKRLLTIMKNAKTIEIPQCLLLYSINSIKYARLIGFCNASSRAYAAVAYLRIKTELHQVHLAAKTMQSWPDRWPDYTSVGVTVCTAVVKTGQLSHTVPA